MVRRAHITGGGLLLEYDRPVTLARRDEVTGVLVLELTAVPAGRSAEAGGTAREER